MMNDKPDFLVIPDRRASERVRDEPLERVRVQPMPERGTVHGIVNCRWGCYENIDAGERFRVKRIPIDPGMKLPAELHTVRFLSRG